MATNICLFNVAMVVAFCSRSQIIVIFFEHRDRRRRGERRRRRRRDRADEHRGPGRRQQSAKRGT